MMERIFMSEYHNMDRLLSLSLVVSQEANAQALEICNLMDEAIKQNKTSILFTTQNHKKIHPLVAHVLTSKGYVIEDITYKLPNNTMSFAYSPCTRYSIYIQ